MTSFPTCVHFGSCSGCQELLSLEASPIWQEILSYFTSYSHLSPILHQSSPLYWRHRAKVAVRGTTQNPQIGLFKQYSHEIVPIPFCLVHHPQLNQAFEKIREWIRLYALLPYDEKTGKGELRYLQGVVQRETGRVQLTCVLNLHPNDARAKKWKSILQLLGQTFPHFWHSLWCNFNEQKTNTIFGNTWTHVWGEEYLWETFEKTAVCYGPASFGQANLPLFEQMLLRIRDLLLQKAQVAEFYAGVGVIGLFIASHCASVKCSEINPHAEYYFNQSLEKLPSAIRSRLSFFSGSTQKSFDLLNDATSVIVDPPRKGLDPLFFSALQEASTVEQLIYVSCGWKAFQQDCQKLCSMGWKVQSVDGYAFFPGSSHVELLTCFQKK